MWLMAVGAYAIGSAVSFTLFGLDKHRARAGRWRISESALLTSALLFGVPGAVVARRLFRHKTREQPFGMILLGIAILHALLLLTLAWVELG